MSKLRDQVTEFHHAMDCPTRARPQLIPPERARLRAKLIAEEFFELMLAIFPSENSEPWGDDAQREIREMLAELDDQLVHVDMVALADALADLDYVVEGTRLEFGIDGGPIADAVHESNMKKLDGPRRDDGKILKPQGWLPPDIAGELRKQGWEG